MVLSGLTTLLFVALVVALLLVLMRSGHQKSTGFSSRRPVRKRQKRVNTLSVSARRHRRAWWGSRRRAAQDTSGEAAEQAQGACAPLPFEQGTGVLEGAVQATLAEASALASAHSAEEQAASLGQADLNDEGTPPPAYMALYLLSENGAPYRGYELLQTLLASGLRYTDESVFAYYPVGDSIADPLFYCASVTQPGTFDLPNMGACSCEGLSLCFSVADSINPVLALESLLKVAECIQEALGGTLVDAEKQPLDAASVRALRASMAQAMPRLKATL